MLKTRQVSALSQTEQEARQTARAEGAFVALLTQSWENVRHIKNERIWFTNIYAIVTAATLSYLHGTAGEPALAVGLLAFLLTLSFIGLLISFRLKVELEDWLRRIDVMVEDAGLERYVSGDLVAPLVAQVKFRWMFVVFYGMTTLGGAALLLSRVFASW